MRDDDDAFRIAHMGHVNAPMMLGVLSTVELGLGATGLAAGRGGVEAAIGWLTAELGAGSRAQASAATGA